MRTVTLEDHEALVLFDFLQREIETRKASRLAGHFEHPAEFWALNNLFCVLEPGTGEVFRHDYERIVEDARTALMAKCDPEGTFVIGSPQ